MVEPSLPACRQHHFSRKNHPLHRIQKTLFLLQKFASELKRKWASGLNTDPHPSPPSTWYEWDHVISLVLNKDRIIVSSSFDTIWNFRTHKHSKSLRALKPRLHDDYPNLLPAQYNFTSININKQRTVRCTFSNTSSSRLHLGTNLKSAVLKLPRLRMRCTLFQRSGLGTSAP